MPGYTLNCIPPAFVKVVNGDTESIFALTTVRMFTACSWRAWGCSSLHSYDQNNTPANNRAIPQSQSKCILAAGAFAAVQEAGARSKDRWKPVVVAFDSWVFIRKFLLAIPDDKDKEVPEDPQSFHLNWTGLFSRYHLGYIVQDVLLSVNGNHIYSIYILNGIFVVSPVL